jgi:hypothetical protein
VALANDRTRVHAQIRPSRARERALCNIFTDSLNRYLVKCYNDLPVSSGRNFAGAMLLVK